MEKKKKLCRKRGSWRKGGWHGVWGYGKKKSLGRNAGKGLVGPTVGDGTGRKKRALPSKKKGGGREGPIKIKAESETPVKKKRHSGTCKKDVSSNQGNATGGKKLGKGDACRHVNLRK